MTADFETLEFPRILERLQDLAASDAAKTALGALSPYLGEEICRRKMDETGAARRVLDACGSPPLAMMKGLEDALSQAKIGAMLAPDSLLSVARFAASCARMTSYLRRTDVSGGGLSAYAAGFENLSELQSEIERCVDEEKVLDEASPQLRDARRKIARAEERIKEKLNQILQSRKQYLAGDYVTTRAGRYVLPVQRRYQSQFGGAVVDVSGKGATVFMEPAAIAGLQAELSALSAQEDEEVRRVLYALSGLVAQQETALRRNIEWMTALDVLFAKAKLSADMKARAVEIGGARKICIRQGRHPLLARETCVPLDFAMDEATRGVIITGPNTGGKTIALKTVGLLTLMAQSGLHIPCEEGSYIAMQDGVYCDIGDSQSIEQSLSTFSGHMTNAVRILEHASPDSLVLLDELGCGTDPAEGMGIAVSILEELRLRGCQFLVTTHYPQVKTYAQTTPGVQSARMAFDRESLRPLYKLEMGKSGESCALDIAARLGLAPHLLSRARRVAYDLPGDKETVKMQAPKSALRRIEPEKPVNDPSGKFQMGDSVLVLPENEPGIVYKPADKYGNVIVQIKGEKRSVNHKRLRLRVSAAELYPEDYDFSILFDSVADRKASHIMGKRNDPNVSILREGRDR